MRGGHVNQCSMLPAEIRTSLMTWHFCCHPVKASSPIQSVHYRPQSVCAGLVFHRQGSQMKLIRSIIIMIFVAVIWAGALAAAGLWIARLIT